MATILNGFTGVSFQVRIYNGDLVIVSNVTVRSIRVLGFVRVVLNYVDDVGTQGAQVRAAARGDNRTYFLRALLMNPLPAMFGVDCILEFVINYVRVITANLRADFRSDRVLVERHRIRGRVKLMTIRRVCRLFRAINVRAYYLGNEVAGDLSGNVTLELHAANGRGLVRRFQVLNRLVNNRYNRATNASGWGSSRFLGQCCVVGGMCVTGMDSFSPLYGKGINFFSLV